MRVRATEDAIVRLLKQGHPLPAATIHAEEEMRLPVFQNIEPMAVRDYGIDSQARIVVARARKEVWFVDIKRRSVPVTERRRDGLLEHSGEGPGAWHTSQVVTGWMVTTNELEPEAQTMLREAECIYTSRAVKRC